MLPTSELMPILSEVGRRYSRSVAIVLEQSDSRWPDGSDKNDFHEFNLAHHLASTLEGYGWGTILEYSHEGIRHDLVAARSDHLIVAETKTLYFPADDKCRGVVADMKRMDDATHVGASLYRKFVLPGGGAFGCPRIVMGSMWVPLDLSLTRSTKHYPYRIALLNWMSGITWPDHLPRDPSAELLCEELGNRVRQGGKKFAVPAISCPDDRQGWFVQWLVGVAW